MKSSVNTLPAVWAAIAVLLVLVGGAVGLTALGRDIQAVLYLYTGIVGVLAGVLPVLFAVNTLNRKTDEQTVQLDQQTAKIDTIVDQTNGELEAKIRNIMRAEMRGRP